MKSYVFKVELEQEDDGRWSAVVPALPCCATWGYTSEEALEALQDMAQGYVDALIDHGKPVPVEKDAPVLEGEAVLVKAKSLA